MILHYSLVDGEPYDKYVKEHRHLKTRKGVISDKIFQGVENK